MIDREIISSCFRTCSKAYVNGVTSLSKVVVTRFAKRGTKYATGGGIAVASGAAYAVGESIGHTKGKKEGTVEQATRDEKKMKEMHQKHENDRKCWNEQKQSYEDLLDKVNN